MSPTELIADRAATHGDWNTQAATAQALKRVLHDSPNWEMLTCQQREALEMVCVKMSRILNGNPDAQDHWDDLAGYWELGRRE